MQTWNLPDHRPSTPGPWSDEPDRAQWVDEATGLDCLILRAPSTGALCGYVGVPEGHSCYGLGYDDVPVDVHGGLTFAGPCQDGEAEDPARICHFPGPGRSDDVWWLGFDCAHFMDVSPLMEERLTLVMGERYPGSGVAVYREFAYVQEECRRLAEQLAAPLA